MANLPATVKIVNASELTLEVGTDNYVMLTNLTMHVGRTEDRIATTDAGALYTYGKGDSWFSATLLLTPAEADSFNDKTIITANGDMPSTTWKIVGKDVTGSIITYTAAGVLRDYDVTKTPEGKVSIDIFVRITTDTVPAALT